MTIGLTMHLALHIVVLIITHSVSIEQLRKMLNLSKDSKIKFVVFVGHSNAQVAFERSLCFAAAFLIVRAFVRRRSVIRVFIVSKKLSGRFGNKYARNPTFAANF